jgi:hypothetical protein
MNGDQTPQTPESGRQHKPVDNPPSLSEPTQRRLDTPSPIKDSPQVAAAPPAPQAAKLQGDDETVSAVTESTDAAGSFYHPDDSGQAETGAVLSAANGDPDETVEWEASGDALRSETAAWRIRMTAMSLVASAVIYLIGRDIISAGSVAVVGLLFAFLGSRKPPSLQYKLDRTGITIGQKHYTYNEFRAFSIVDDLRSPSINIVPLKRFLPLLSIHYDPQQRDKIVGVLADHLPLEMRRRDAFDSIINRVKF